MLEQGLKISLIAAAISAACAAQASDYVTAGGAPLRTGYGGCVQTGYWTAQSAECDPKPIAEAAAKAATPVEPNVARTAQRFTYSAEVLFGFDEAKLTDKGRELLDELYQKVRSGDLERLDAVGHADALGSDEYNQGLSERRAIAVRDYLVGKGLPEELLGFEGRGKREPVTSGACDYITARRSHAQLVECLRADRRVEIEIAGRVRSAPTTADAGRRAPW